MNSDEFLGKIAHLLDSKDTDEALNEVLDDSNDSLVHLTCMDLIPLVCTRMYNRELLAHDPEAWGHMESILEYIVKTCKPKEVLIALLEQAECIKSDAMFHLLATFLKISFIRCPSKRGDDSFLWALNALYKYIAALPLPQYEFEESETAILENCPQTVLLEECVATCLAFCGPFVSEAKHCNRRVSAEMRTMRIVQLASFLLKLIEKPISSFELGAKRAYKTAFQKTAARTVHLLSELCPNFVHKIVEWQNLGLLSLRCRLAEPSDNKTASVSNSAVGVLFYLVFAEQYSICSWPCVYSLGYRRSLIFPFCVELMAQSFNSTLLSKAVMLTEGLLNQVNDGDWDQDVLKDETRIDILLGLINVMQTCNIKGTRQKALSTFTKLLNCFQSPAHIIIIKLLNYQLPNSEFTNKRWQFSNVSGILGWLTDWYRKHLVSEMGQDLQNRPYFAVLEEMLELFCRLREREKSDLLEIFDQIMANLNLLLFLGLRRDAFPLAARLVANVKQDYLKMLGRGIDLSIAHYKLELANVAKEVKEEDEDERDDKIDMLNNALTRFDLVASLLARVNQVFI